MPNVIWYHRKLFGLFMEACVKFGRHLNCFLALLIIALAMKNSIKKWIKLIGSIAHPSYLFDPLFIKNF